MNPLVEENRLPRIPKTPMTGFLFPTIPISPPNYPSRTHGSCRRRYRRLLHAHRRDYEKRRHQVHPDNRSPRDVELRYPAVELASAVKPLIHHSARFTHSLFERPHRLSFRLIEIKNCLLHLALSFSLP